MYELEVKVNLKWSMCAWYQDLTEEEWMDSDEPGMRQNSKTLSIEWTNLTAASYLNLLKAFLLLFKYFHLKIF